MATVLIILTTVTSYFTAGYLYLSIATNYQIYSEITAELLNHAAFSFKHCKLPEIKSFQHSIICSGISSWLFFWEQEQKSHFWRSVEPGCIFCGVDSSKGN